MSGEIQKLITLITDDLKCALDNLFDVVNEDYNDRASGFGQTRKEKKEKIRKAWELYNKHFVC